MNNIKIHQDIYQRTGALAKVLTIKDELAISAVVWDITGSSGDNPLTFSFLGTEYTINNNAAFINTFQDLDSEDGITTSDQFYTPGAGNGGTDAWGFRVTLSPDAVDYSLGDSVFYTYTIGGTVINGTFVENEFAPTGNRYVDNQRPFHFLTGMRYYTSALTSNTSLHGLPFTHYSAGFYFCEAHDPRITKLINPESFCQENNTTAPRTDLLMLMDKATRHEGKVYLTFRDANVKTITHVLVLEYSDQGI